MGEKVKTLSKGVIFWWRLLDDVMPTSHWFYIRGIGDSIACTWDYTKVEDYNCIIVNYTQLQKNFQKLVEWRISFLTLTSVQDIIKHFTNVTSHNIALTIIYYSVVYQCQRATNAKKIWRILTIMPSTILEALTHTHTHTCIPSRSIGTPLHHLGCYPKPVGAPNPLLWIKCNVDGSCF